MSEKPRKRLLGRLEYLEMAGEILVAYFQELPYVETLPRASDIPPSQQQAELLRAAQYGKETPAEELLRASTTDRQDT